MHTSFLLFSWFSQNHCMGCLLLENRLTFTALLLWLLTLKRRLKLESCLRWHKRGSSYDYQIYGRSIYGYAIMLGVVVMS